MLQLVAFQPIFLHTDKNSLLTPRIQQAHRVGSGQILPSMGKFPFETLHRSAAAWVGNLQSRRERDLGSPDEAPKGLHGSIDFGARAILRLVR